jgi:hypothetical protein
VTLGAGPAASTRREIKFNSSTLLPCCVGRWTISERWRSYRSL